jgi:ubiquinone/menaquinone biosynthesis C-methylase UbiE
VGEGAGGPAGGVAMADYSTVTETVGTGLTREALAMMATRNAYASEWARGARVLEVGCGAGQGLGRLASTARTVVGGDYTYSLLVGARRHYGARVLLVCLDGQRLPFEAESFDRVLLFEAIYYLADQAAFVRECRRVLAPGGGVMICAANPERDGFNPSPFSTRYPTAAELHDLLTGGGFDTQLFGAYADKGGGPLRSAVALVRRLAVALHLVPKTMRGKEMLKRLFYGRLERLPPELATFEGVERPERLTDLSGARRYKVIYAVGHIRAEGEEARRGAGQNQSQLGNISR